MRFTRVALSPDPDLAVAALMIARLEYPHLDAGPYIEELDAMGRDAARPGRACAAGRRHAAGRRPRSVRARRRAERLPVQGTAVRRQHHSLRGPAQHLPQRGPRAAHRHPDHARAGLHGGGAARGPHRRGRQLPGPFPRALSDAAGALQGLDHRRVPRRGAPLRGRLPEAAAAACRRGGGVGRRASPARERPSRRSWRGCWST